jgi:hypothetical protein
MTEKSRVWMAPPWGHGEPKEVEATPEALASLMAAGWSQCAPPRQCEEVTENVHD